MRKLMKAFVRDERGVSAMEYAVLAGIVVVALGAMSTVFSSGLTTMFGTLFSNVNKAVNSSSK
ncbi:Flp family type IVb pilin [Caballeronia sp. Lep1P3]|uniref:Flp family type IVb pilin n=1 Tax=Caballeronia sp. Lep1P3 TaxID=2878150 RepID=UPI001FD61874|nr:Flp family type IVb pilin [Caballeronia sp. Lep1P3]